MKESLFLNACRGLPTSRPPIWIMRQAGRYLPEYRELRKGISMLEAISNPDVAIEATLQPIRRFGFDAAILFSDLTIPFIPMGAPFEIVENKGPVLEKSIRTLSDLNSLRRFVPEEGLRFVMEAIRGLKKELNVPLIGFTGAPFTLASYLIEGGPSRNLQNTKALMKSDQEFWTQLMALLEDVIVDYISAQVKAGADAIQLFDSWVGHLDPDSYHTYLFPTIRAIFTRLRPLNVPIIHFGTGNPLLLPLLADAGGDVIGVDYRVSLTQASQMVPGKVLQGNLDPAILFANRETVIDATHKVLRKGQSLTGHIFNLGHGILPGTPLDNVYAVVDTVKECDCSAT